MGYDAYQEHLDHEAGVEFTDWVVARRAALEGAPVRGEEGWCEEIDAARDSIEALINGGAA
jgi:hypothetical protein